jgi:hypothetical protein
MGELREAHSMLCLLFAHAPEVLLNVIPYLEEALQGGSLQLRVLTTETLGAIFGSPSGATIAPVGNMTIAESYHSTWQMWMGRRADKAIQVRVAWVGAARNVLVHHPELRSSVEGTGEANEKVPRDRLADRDLIHLQSVLSKSSQTSRTESERLPAGRWGHWTMR